MIVLREVEFHDINGLEALSKVAAEFHPGFLNLAHDKDQWKEKVRQSIDSFSGKIKNKADAKYIFVAEDTAVGKIVGMSMVSAQHGTQEVPHFFFELGSEQRFSSTISTGFIHGTLTLKSDSDGPTEIGGLLVDPEYRKHSSKVGKQISFVRFLYIGTYRQRFKDKILAELLPPLTKKGKASLWEAIGRRFTNLDYPEADELSLKNKEFILSLFPSEKIYVTFLPAEARNAIGKVSKDTEPVLHMLKKIGFSYTNQVDPFDGGPHLWGDTDKILPIKNIKKLKYTDLLSDKMTEKEFGILSPAVTGAKFVALCADIVHDGAVIYFDRALADTLGLKKDSDVWFLSY